MELQLTPRKETRLNSKQRQNYWAQGLVPAAVYGRSLEAGVCFVNAKHSRHWHTGSMFDVKWSGKAYKASIDEIQYEPVSHKIVHVSFHLVGKNETTHISVPVRTVGHAPGEKEGGMVQVHLDSITIEGKPDMIPDYFEIDVAELHVGDKVTIGDLTPPSGCKWYHHTEDQTIVTCSHIKVQPVEEPETAAAVSPEDVPAAQDEQHAEPADDKEAA